MDPRLVSDLATNLQAPLDLMYQENGRLYNAWTKKEVKGVNISEGGIVYNTDGLPVGFIRMPTKSMLDKIRKIINLLKGGHKGSLKDAAQERC